MADNGGRGFASMDDDKQREIAQKGGEANAEKHGAENLKNVNRSEAGRMGAQAQPRAGKVKGGQNSHRGDNE